MRILRPRIAAQAALVLLIAALACRSYPLGKLAVKVIDSKGKPLRGAAVDLYKLTPSGKVYWRASSTDSLGIAVLGAQNGGVIEGNYLIHVSFISWHKLAAGETNDKPVTVKAGSDTVVTFRVVQKLPVRHPGSTP